MVEAREGILIAKPLRYTKQARLAMKGEGLYKISVLMSNSPEICRRHYTALMPESLFESVDFNINKTLTNGINNYE